MSSTSICYPSTFSLCRSLVRSVNVVTHFLRFLATSSSTSHNSILKHPMSLGIDQWNPHNCLIRCVNQKCSKVALKWSYGMLKIGLTKFGESELRHLT